MKSRKLRAVFAALSAVAVLASAMTGFAAATVTTTTEYNTGSDYAHVTSVVTGAKGDVTYLATTTAGYGVNESGILYIDQKSVTEGSATFDYLVDKSVIHGVNTTLALGTNGSEAIAQPENGIALYARSDKDYEAGYHIDYINRIFGNGEGTITVVITPLRGFVIESVTIGGEAQEAGLASYEVPVSADGKLASIEVTTAAAEGDPVLADFVDIFSDDNCTVTTILKPTGNWAEVGVTYYDYEFPAEGNVNNLGYVAVKLTDDEPIDSTKYSNYIR